MKKYIVYFILLIILLVGNLLFFNKNRWISINNNVNLADQIVNYNYTYLSSNITKPYIIDYNIVNTHVMFYMEESYMNFASTITNMLFDNNISSSDFMSIYYVRNPFNYFSYSDYSLENYNYNYSNIAKIKELLKDYEVYSINDIKFVYPYTDKQVIQVYVNSSLGELLFEYQICDEVSSGKLKLENVILYYLDEVKKFSNNSYINKYSFNGTQGLSYINDVSISSLNNVKKSILKVDVVDDHKIIDSVSGFFVSNGFFLTSFDIFSNYIFDDYTYRISDLFGNFYTYDGLVTFSKHYNVAIVKIKEQLGEGVTFNSSIMEDSSLVFLIDNNITVGSYIGLLNNNDNFIRSSVYFEKSDRGSALFNIDGEVVGINTILCNGNNSLLSLQYYSISNAIKNIKENVYEEIPVIRLIPSLIEVR